jgi:arsenate reductase (thioredoxin)
MKWRTSTPPIPLTFVVPFRVLFVCTHNSARSQMAEALLRARGGDDFRAFSAGTHPGHVHPLAIRVMAELGVDLSKQAGHHAKGIEACANAPPMDLVVTVCDQAAEICPHFPRARSQVHWGFPDPASATGTEHKRVHAFRHIRDLIATRITQYLATRVEITSVAGRLIPHTWGDVNR